LVNQNHRYGTSADVGGDFNSGSNWRKKATNFVVPSARQIRCRGRGMVDMPPNYGKDEYAGAGEYVNPLLVWGEVPRAVLLPW
jgi:hypothetical protein